MKNVRNANGPLNLLLMAMVSYGKKYVMLRDKGVPHWLGKVPSVPADAKP